MQSHPDQEHFGEASLGEAQSSNPPPDPEMLEDARDESEEDFAAELEQDPAHNPSVPELKDIKGG